MTGWKFTQKTDGLVVTVDQLLDSQTNSLIRMSIASLCYMSFIAKEPVIQAGGVLALLGIFGALYTYPRRARVLVEETSVVVQARAGKFLSGHVEKRLPIDGLDVAWSAPSREDMGGLTFRSGTSGEVVCRGVPAAASDLLRLQTLLSSIKPGGVG